MLKHNNRRIRTAGSLLVLAFLTSNNASSSGIQCIDSGDGKVCVASYCYASGVDCVSEIGCSISQTFATSNPTFSISTTNPQHIITKLLFQPAISNYSAATELQITKKVGGTTVASKVLKASGASVPVLFEYDATDVFGKIDINGTYNIYVYEDWASSNNNCLNLGDYNLIIYYECPNDIGCDNVPDLPLLVSSPTSYNYNSVSVGQKSVSKTYTISNSGKANFTIKEITKAGTNPGEFHKTADNCTGKTLDFHTGVNNSCTFQYQFSPETPGAKTANLLILTDILKSAQSTIAVSGLATSVQKIQVVPGTDSFLSIPAGVTSSPHIYTITNNGLGQLQLGTIAISGSNAADFKISNDQCSGKTLNSNAICTFQTVFRPTSQGSKSASITIPSDDQNAGVLSVPLTGTALAASVSYCN